MPMSVVVRSPVRNVLLYSLFVMSPLFIGGCQMMTSADEEQAADIVAPLGSSVECPDLVIPEPEPVVCPAPPPAPPPKIVYRAGPESKVANVISVDDKLIVGRVEHIGVGQENIVVKARMDTGATYSSLNALEMKSFERDGQAWVRFAILDPNNKDKKVFMERKVKRYKSIKQIGAPSQRRPIVVMTLNMGKLSEKVDVTLVDRTGYLYQLLVGRNFLRDRALVDVSKKFITIPQAKPVGPVVSQ